MISVDGEEEVSFWRPKRERVRTEGRRTHEDIKSETVGGLVVGCFLGDFGVFGDAIHLLVVN